MDPGIPATIATMVVAKQPLIYYGLYTTKPGEPCFYVLMVFEG